MGLLYLLLLLVLLLLLLLLLLLQHSIISISARRDQVMENFRQDS